MSQQSREFLIRVERASADFERRIVDQFGDLPEDIALQVELVGEELERLTTLAEEWDD